LKAVCLISGGIDSPVAAQISISNGFQPILLHYHNYPFHSLGTLEKVVIISNKLAERNAEMEIVLAIVPHGKSQEIILNSLNDNEKRYTCLLCRLQMFIKAQAFAKNIGAELIITGEILGEQASQTLDNLPIVTSKVDITVLRPLLGYNKEEVISLSRKWNLYNSSILPGGCCSINPRYPVTKGNIDFVEKIYERESVKLNSIIQEELKHIHQFPLPVEIDNVLEVIEV
jgi:thiamine biosynthesis protein ThiI